MELTGKIEKIGDIQEISASFKKRELVIRTEEQYPQPIMIEFVQDKTNLLDGYNLGDRVTVNINIRGREWTSPKGEVKYFVSLQGWRINADQAQQTEAPTSEPPSFDAPDAPAPDFSLKPEDDDLPF
jgi:single-strand DNA-binding protein